MATDVATCRPEEDLQTVLARLRERRVRRLPVVDDANQVLGLISLVDIARGATLPGASCSPDEVATTLADISAPPRDAAY